MVDATAKTTCPRVFFTPKLDIIVLNLVIELNPFTNTWEEVVQAMSIAVKKRTLTERVMRLIRLYRADETASLRKSGTEEEYNERDRLLQEVAELEASSTKEKDGKDDSAKVKREKERKAAEAVRTAAMQTRRERESDDETEDDAQKKRTRMTSSGLLSYIKEKNSTEASLKREELQLKRDQLAHEQQKFAAEKEDRIAERQERTAMMQVLMNLLKK